MTKHKVLHRDGVRKGYSARSARMLAETAVKATPRIFDKGREMLEGELPERTPARQGSAASQLSTGKRSLLTCVYRRTVETGAVDL